MASFDDLGQVLRDDAAANAPRASMIDVDAVARAARARRLPRQWAVGTLSLVAVLGLGGIAVAAVTPPLMIAASESADLEAEATESGSAPMADGGGEEQRLDDVNLVDLVACGADATSAEQVGGALELNVLTPSSAAADVEAFDATAVLVNNGTSTLSLTTGTTAVAVVTQNGVVVGIELAREDAALQFDLAPGQTRELPMLVSTLDCRGAGAEALPSGTYAITVVLDVLEPATGEWSLIIAPAAEIRLD